MSTGSSRTVSRGCGERRREAKVTPAKALSTTPFSLVAVDLTLLQLCALPAGPGALKAWIAEALKRSDARTSVVSSSRETGNKLASSR